MSLWSDSSSSSSGPSTAYLVLNASSGNFKINHHVLIYTFNSFHHSILPSGIDTAGSTCTARHVSASRSATLRDE
jgi:hypothetical protein